MSGTRTGIKSIFHLIFLIGFRNYSSASATIHRLPQLFIGFRNYTSASATIMSWMENTPLRSPVSETRLPTLGDVAISVALCSYNGEAYVRQQLDSIAAQTLHPLEVVICDDRSTDKTISILEEFQRTSSFPVRLYRNEKQLGTTRNFEKAMRLCIGEFIALSDQDDIWDPRKIETLAALLLANPAVDGTFSDALLIDSDSKPTGRRLWQDFRFTATKQREFIEHPMAMLLKHDVVTGATMMIRSSLLRNFREIPQSWLHDGWLSWMVALDNRFVLTQEPLTLYRIHANQQVGTGRGSLLARIREIRATERTRYRRVQIQFEDLLDFVRTTRPEVTPLVQALEEKCRFVGERAQLPNSQLYKAIFILRNISHYYRYGRGLYSVRKDLAL